MAPTSKLDKELLLADWPVPSYLRELRDMLVTSGKWETSPLALYHDVDGDTKLVLPSNYEASLKGAVAHVACILIAWDMNDYVRFNLEVSEMTILDSPEIASVEPQSRTPTKRKIQGPSYSSSSSPSKKSRAR